MAVDLRSACERGKAHALGVVTEGARYNAAGLAGYFNCCNRSSPARLQQGSHRQAGRVLLMPGISLALLLMKAGCQNVMLCAV